MRVRVRVSVCLCLCVCVGGGSVYKQYNKICRVQVSLHIILVFITFFSPFFVFPGRSATLCQEHLLRYLNNPQPDRFEPRCKPNGDYQEIQCHDAACFCVDKKGTEIQETRKKIALGKPLCPPSGRISAFILAFSWRFISDYTAQFGPKAVVSVSFEFRYE